MPGDRRPLLLVEQSLLACNDVCGGSLENGLSGMGELNPSLRLVEISWIRR